MRRQDTPNTVRLRGKFTIIELLMVIAIIAILAGMLLPALNKARDMAKKINCVSNQKSCGTAVIMYAGDYKEWHPLAFVGDNFYTNWEYRNIINQFAGWAIGLYTGYRYVNANSQNAPKVMFCSAANQEKTSFFVYNDKKIYRQFPVPPRIGGSAFQHPMEQRGKPRILRRAPAGKCKAPRASWSDVGCRDTGKSCRTSLAWSCGIGALGRF